MDNFYDKEKARICLEQLVQDRQRRSPHTQLTAILSPNGIEKLDITSVSRPRMLRLISANESSSKDHIEAVEEIVVHIQGILAEFKLPPITKQTRLRIEGRRYWKQSVQLTGLGAPFFEDCIQKIREIEALFMRHLPADTLNVWQENNVDEHPAIYAANNYFTDRHDRGTQTPIPFPSNIDPHRILSKAMGQEFVHLHDNEVCYFEAQHNTHTKKTVHSQIDPVKFHVGDLVEAQISFCAVPIKNHRHRLLVILRGLTLLNNKPSMNADVARVIAQTSKPKITSIVLKRKIGYTENDDSDEEERAMVQQVKHMRMDDTAE